MAKKPRGRIEEKFAELRARGEAALIPFVVAGDPGPEATRALARGLAAGADLTPEERARSERWLTFWRQLRQRRAAVLVPTTGKSQAEIVRDMADAMRGAGLLKE